MKKEMMIVTLVGLLLAGSAFGVNTLLEFKVDPTIELPTASEQAHEAWKDRRFGMFIHWGPISQFGLALSHSRNSPSHRPGGGKPYKVGAVESEVYDNLYKTFNPVDFDPDGMMKMAKAAGVQYIVFTAKHHAGFSMFDSAVTDYDMMSTPYNKDISKMLSNACRDNGIEFGIYYSPRDWYHPDCDAGENHSRYIRFYKSQMEELLSNYGRIHEIWYDGLGPGDWGDTAAEVMGYVRERHPDTMVNDRGGAGADFYTPEHFVGYFNREESWEACHTTTSRRWGYSPEVSVKSLNQLMEILLYTWGGDGNILLNIGPKPDGMVRPVERERFEQLAQWWSVHGEDSIRGSRGGPYLPGPWGVSTCKGNRTFLHVFHWPEQGGLHFPALENLKLESARVLTGGKVSAVQTDTGFTVDVPKAGRGAILTTVELVFDQPVYPVKPLQRIPSLTRSATLTSSHNANLLPALSDQNATTTWKASAGKGEEIWIEASFAEPQTIASFSMFRGHSEWLATPKVMELLVSDGDGGWKNVAPKGVSLMRYEPIKFLKEPVTTDRVRLRIAQPAKYYLVEFELYPPIR